MSEPFIGEIRNFAFNYAPVGWAICNGSLLPIQQNPALYALLMTQFGGDGRNTFGLPDLRGRVPVGSTAATSPPPAPLASYNTGAQGGTETVTLTSVNVPSHAHSVTVAVDNGNTTGPAGNLISTAVPATTGTPANIDCYLDTGWSADVHLNADSIGISGSSAPHNNMQPFLVTNYCIATTGFFPPRN